MKKITTLLLFLSALPVFGTHLIGGYIQVQNVSSSTYAITIRLYMEQSPASMGESSVLVCLDNGLEPVLANRINSLALEGGILLNEYRLTHTYNGSGSGFRTLSVAPSNRVDSRTHSSSGPSPFYLKTTFTTTQANSTPVFQRLDKRLTGLVNQENRYRFMASDSEGDSVVHHLMKVQQGECGLSSQPISGYRFPNEVTRRGTFRLGTRDGQLVWNAPTETGTYGFVILAEEWRKGERISETIFDMVTLIVDGGTPGTIPAYEPVLERGLLTGLDERIDDRDLTTTVFPSPSSSRFQVVLKSRKPTTATFQLLDSQGKVIQEATSKTASLEHQQVLGSEQLAPGLYLIRTSARGRIYTNKVIKR